MLENPFLFVIYIEVVLKQEGEIMLSFYLNMVETREDHDKVTFIYDNFYPLMKHIVLGYVKKAEDVEDIVQESMLSIIECIRKIDTSNRNKLKNFCAIVARNKAIDFCRVKGNHVLSVNEEIENGVTVEEIPESTLLQKETYTLILKTINSLNDLYRDVCILKYIHQLKEKEIAMLLSIDPKTVSVRIYRGRRILQEALRKEYRRG